MNAIVGPNGSGKTTILRAIASCDSCRKEIDTPAVFRLFEAVKRDPQRGRPEDHNMENTILEIRAMFSSHGQSMKDALSVFRCDPGDTLLFDEPETAQDIESIVKLRDVLDTFCANGAQVIVVSHHPIFWENARLIELVDGYADKIVSILRQRL